MKTLIAILALTLSVSAQTTVTVPAASATTPGVVTFDNNSIILNAARQLSVAATASTFPTWVTFDNTTQTMSVPNLTITNTLTITGGTPYADGIYVVKITGGVLTFVLLSSIPQTVTIPAQTVPVNP